MSATRQSLGSLGTCSKRQAPWALHTCPGPPHTGDLGPLVSGVDDLGADGNRAMHHLEKGSRVLGASRCSPSVLQGAQLLD